jgi:signal transduction histidine kinase
LKTPLALIYGYAEMIGDFPGEATPEQTRVIMDEAKRLATLVDDVLDISKMESDMEKLDVSVFSLTGLVSEATERMRALLENDGFDIAFSYDTDAYVEADDTTLGRVFHNLLVNAVNYSGDCLKISVSQTVADGVVRIGVADGGEGISEGELPYIWDRYYRSGKGHTRAVTGTGLGLSIVKKIMDMHGGGYGVVSEVGKGSTFWFELRVVRQCDHI